jgi:hypothetical protein
MLRECERIRPSAQMTEASVRVLINLLSPSHQATTAEPIAVDYSPGLSLGTREDGKEKSYH